MLFILNNMGVMKSNEAFSIKYPVYQFMDTNFKLIKDMISEFYERQFLFSDVNVTDRKVNIIFSGNSGSMIATLLYSYMLERNPYQKIEMVLIRKPKDDSHDVMTHQYDFNNINIFIDDHIFYGETYFRCLNECARISRNKDFQFDFVVCSWIRSKTFNRIVPKNIFYSGTIR